MLSLPWVEIQSKFSTLSVNGKKSGGIAQLVERLVRNEKVRGSNPLTSSPENFRGCRLLLTGGSKCGTKVADEMSMLAVSRCVVRLSQQG